MFQNIIGKYTCSTAMPEPCYIDNDIDIFCYCIGFPRVIGAIDGSLIPIKAPYENEVAFVCRKRYHAINIQVSTCIIIPHPKRSPAILAQFNN